MQGDDNRRGFGGYRKQSYPEKSGNYSPSTSYNYNPAGNQGNSGGGGGGYQQQNPRHRNDRFKREGGGHSNNSSDRLVKQNATIINLLQEISDKLSMLNGTPRTPQVKADRPTNSAPPVPQDPEQYAGDDEAADDAGLAPIAQEEVGREPDAAAEEQSEKGNRR